MADFRSIKHAWKLLFIALLAPAVMAVSSAQAADAVDGELIVGFSDSTPQSAVEKIADQADATVEDRYATIDAALLKADPGQSIEEVSNALDSSSRVDYVEPNYQVETDVTPNDPQFSSQWALQNSGQSSGTGGADINATLAWTSLTGSTNTVAVLDTGVTCNHPDLAANMWANPAETPNNSVDDDGNGYVDDYCGVDIVNGDGNPAADDDPTYHGTHVAGIIGAVGNNGVGISGVSWRAKIMAVKVLNSSGAGSYANIVAGIDYARTNGAKVINASFGGGSASQALSDAISTFGASGGVLVASAGNSSANLDSSPQYPASYNLSNIISVGASNRNDDRASFSNYGATAVDVFAPGQDILSTKAPDTYQSLSGTSMSAPVVTGAVALYIQGHAATPAQVRDAVTRSAAPKATFSGLAVSGGRLNLAALLGVTVPSNDPPSSSTPVAEEEKPVTKKVDPAVEVTKVKVKGLKGTFTGKFDAAASGSLTVYATYKRTITVNRHGRKVKKTVEKRVKATALQIAADGSWTAKINFPKPATYTVVAKFSESSGAVIDSAQAVVKVAKGKKKK